MQKSIKNLWSKLWDFDYSDDEEDNCRREQRRSTSLSHKDPFRVSTSRVEREQSSTIPCEFCNVPYSQDLIRPHQILCSRNPFNVQQPSAPPMPPAVHERVWSTSHGDASYRTNPSASNSAITSANGLYSLRCSITQELFIDPVIAEDGHTYEREAIEQWIAQAGTSPNTRQPLTIAGLRPNLAVKSAAEELRASRRNSNRQTATPPISRSFKYKLNIDVRKTTELPFAQTFGKALFSAEWITRRNRSGRILLLHITGGRAAKEAYLNVQLPLDPHIVRTFGLVQHDGEGMLLLQEYAEQGNLFDLLHTERQAPSPAVIDNLILQIVDALIFLTRQEIIHGDLACRNVLVFRYDRVNPADNLVKLTDFGISRRSGAVTSLDIIPLLSAAPEVLRSGNYSEKSDVWALAVLAWEIYSKGSTPTVSQAYMDFEAHTGHILAGERLSRPEACPAAKWQIFLQCMNQNPTWRPTFVQLREKLLRF